MYTFPALGFKEICAFFESDALTDDAKDLLGQSLFYYCCGQDPTPIAAFGGGYPLYVYADNLTFGITDFESALRRLYDRLSEAKFLLKMKYTLKQVGRMRCAKNAEITLWRTPKREYFLLMYIQSDADKAFRSIYGENSNYIQPKCICNYRYEMDASFFAPIEKLAQYIMGHCHNDKYRLIGEYDYLGDYGSGEQKVPLYQCVSPSDY